MPHSADRRFLPPLSLPSRLPARTLLGALLFVACSGGAELLLPGDGEPAVIELKQGGTQTGRVGEPLAQLLVFEVLDSRARPVEAAQVVFELSSAGPEAAMVPDPATTDANGEVEVRMVLGTRIGPQTVEARVVVPEGAQQPTTTFTIMAFAEDANGMSAVFGDDQSAPAGSALPQALVVQVTDAFGNPISGVPITWTAPEGGSVSEASNLTDGEGRASVIRTLGPTAGAQTTVAESENLAGSPVTFTHTATAGSATGLSIVSGNEQTAEAGTELPGDLVVRLVDASGNGVPDAAVTWVVGTGGGRVSPENTSTDEAGRASTRWTLGRSPGPNRVDAVVSGVGVVTFTATGTAVRPARLTIVTQPSGSAQNGVRLERQPVVRVEDGRSGVVVTAQLSGGSGELLGTRQRVTGADGSAAFTDLAIAGAEGARTLVFTASGYAGATSSVIQVQPIPTTTTITSDSPDPSVVGGTITVAFQVRSAGPVPVGSVTVTVSDGGANCTGTLQNGSGSCQLQLNRAGTRTLRASYSGAPGFLRSSGTTTHVVNPAPSENRAPDADYNWHCEGLTCDFVDRSDDRDGQVTRWSWNFGDGTPAVSQQNPTHTYAGPGNYTVTLTATDNDGASDASSATVRVRAPEPPPPGGTATTIVSDNPDPSQPGQAITVGFIVTSSSGTPTGTVRVTDERGGECTGSAPSGSCSYVPQGTGTRTITARYEGSSSFRGSSGSAEHTVSEPPPAATSTSISSSPNPSEPDQDVTVSFTVSSSSGGTPEGNVRITESGRELCNGNAPTGSCSFEPDWTGPRTLTATYEGNESFQGSSGITEHVVNSPPAPAPTSTSISSNPNPSEPDQDVTVSFTVSSSSGGAPEGNVRITEGERELCNGNAPAGSCSFEPDWIGPRTLTATYEGNENFQGSSGTIEHVVTSPPPPNEAPTAVIGSISCTGMNCSFTDASTDSNGADTIAEWNWVFGDGGTSTQRNPSHLYQIEGPYIVTLTVKDDQGLSSPNTDEESISVTGSGGDGGDGESDLVAKVDRS